MDIIAEAAAVVEGANRDAVVRQIATLLTENPDSKFMFVLADAVSPEAMMLHVCSNVSGPEAMWIVSAVAQSIIAQQDAP